MGLPKGRQIMQQGQIVKIHSDFYYVNSKEGLVECKVREILKKRKDKVFVGDYVCFQNSAIEEILPRKNFIPRPSVANLDYVVIVSALREPDLDFIQLNRYLCLSRYYSVPAVLCFNKEDLEDDDFMYKKIESIYNPLGYKIFFTSAKEKLGIKELKSFLQGKTCVLCGSSGVGKSSLINAINPNINLRTKQVSDKTKRGIHTTRHSEIIEIGDIKIVDTPGFSNLKFDFLLPQDVSGLFEEISSLKPACKYKNCLHTKEDGCAVLENLSSIDETRYKSYLEFIKEAKNFKEKIKFEGNKEETSKKLIHNREFAKLNGHKRQVARNTIKQNLNKEVDY